MKPRWLDRKTVQSPYPTLCLSAEEFAAAARHCQIMPAHDWLDPDRHMATTHDWRLRDKLVCVVCLHPDAMGANPIQVACTLVHEAVHVFQRLCDSIGEVAPSREFEAYSIERIAEELMREFARRAQTT